MSVCTFGWAPIFALARHCSCLCSLRSCVFVLLYVYISLTSVHSVRMQKFLRYSITSLIKFCIFAISRCSMCISTEYVCTDMHEIMYMLCVCMMYTFLTRMCVNLDRLRWTIDVYACVSVPVNINAMRERSTANFLRWANWLTLSNNAKCNRNEIASNLLHPIWLKIWYNCSSQQ